MLCLLLIVYCLYINQLSAEIQLNCTFPAYPKNGLYTILEGFGDTSIASNDKVKSFKLKLGCLDGYAGVGSDTLVCHEDGTMTNVDFECLPTCAQSGNVLSCGTDARYVINTAADQTNYSLRNLDNSGSQENDEDCGVRDTAYFHLYRPDGYSVGYAADGYSAVHGEFPWHAGIFTKKSRPYKQICGGTLVSHTVIISAAHCFWLLDRQLPAAQYAVAVGKIYRRWDEPRDHDAQKSDVKEIRIPAYFHGHTTNLQDDIALVIVTSPFKFGVGVRPACLDFHEQMDQKQLKPNMNLGTVAGWGITGENDQASIVLNVILLPVVDLRECFQKSDPAFRAYITSDKFCAGWSNGTAVCMGDSGGGFLIPESTGQDMRYFLRGVVSGSPQTESLCNIYTWATFTHLLKHERFIKDALKESRSAA